jgi:ribosomal protein L13E
MSELKRITDQQREYHLREFDKLSAEVAELIKSSAQLFNLGSSRQERSSRGFSHQEVRKVMLSRPYY